VGFVYLGVMVLTWAGNRPLMKLALGEVPPLVFVLLRLIGSLILIAPALARNAAAAFAGARRAVDAVLGRTAAGSWVPDLQRLG
jgi:drug/metabolite transporter (DMT)-like permease